MARFVSFTRNWRQILFAKYIIFALRLKEKKLSLSSKPIKETIKKILVVRLDRIGDLLLTTPLIRGLKENFKDSKITVLANKYNHVVLSGNPSVDELIIYESMSFSSLLQKLKGEEFDLAIDPNSGFLLDSALVCHAVNPKWSMGYCNKYAEYFFNETMTAEISFYEAKKHLSFLKTFGIENVACELEIYESESDRGKAKQFISDNFTEDKPLVILNPGARRKPHRWELEKFAKLADKLISELKCQILISWGPEEYNLASNMAKKMQGKSKLAYPSTISELSALIAKCKFFVCADTAPIHIASAKKVPIVAIYGTSDSIRWLNNEKSNIFVIGGKPCKEISVEEVFKQCKLALAK